MTVNAIQDASSTGYIPQPSSTATSSADTSSTSVTKNMFLQLMVAQLKNQDPLNPSDSTAFVGQLAQFQQLEQSLNSSQDTAAIRADLDQLVAAQTATGSTSKS
jgi:flagellar basal-body rod modification protein FlgD